MTPVFVKIRRRRAVRGTAGLLAAVSLCSTLGLASGHAFAGSLVQSAWTATNTATGATDVTYTWSFVTASTAALSSITLGVPAGTATAGPTIESMFGLGTDASAGPRLSDGSVQVALSGGMVIRAGTLVSIAIAGITNSTTSFFGASTITTTNGATIDQGTTNALSFVANASALTVVVPESASVATPPSAPLAVLAEVPTDPVIADSAVVSWTPPLSDGGATLDSYTVVPLDISTGSTGGALGVDGNTTSVTVGGLAAGDAYAFTVSAVNRAGTGQASNASNVVVPTTAPSLGTTSDTATSTSSTGVVQVTVSSTTAATRSDASGTTPAVPRTTLPAASAVSIGASSVAAIPTSAPIAPLVVSATAVGSGSLTVAYFGADPMPKLVPPVTGSTASYIDVKASGSNHFSSVTFTACGLVPGSNVEWWNPLAQALVPVSSVSPDPNQPTCIDVDISSSSTPSIAELYGTLFVVRRPGIGQGVIVANVGGRVFTRGLTPSSLLVGAERRSDSGYVAVIASPDGNGYLLISAAGAVTVFGDATFHGSLPSDNIVPGSPVVAGALTPDAKGYWLVTKAGVVYRFGDARFFGSIRSMDRALRVQVVGFATVPNGKGYWIATAGGSIYQYGEASFLGSLRTEHASPGAPVVGLAAAPDGKGYWLAAANGAVYAFGSAASNAVASHSPRLQWVSITGLAVTPDGLGYWLIGRHGVLHAFGDATRFASVPKSAVTPTSLIAGIAAIS